MIPLAGSDYGVLQPVVSDAGSLVAATVAIASTWRGRAKWEPSEEDVSAGPQRVGGLVAAILIAVLWFQTNGSSKGHRFLIPLVIILAIVCVASLCLYSFLIAMQTYEKQRVLPNGTLRKQKVIGGFALTRRAKSTMAEREDLTIQDLFEGSAYDVDRVWTRQSRAIAKLLFVLCYLGLTVSGTVALAGAAILVGGVQ